jgi:hypothetical protein
MAGGLCQFNHSCNIDIGDMNAAGVIQHRNFLCVNLMYLVFYTGPKPKPEHWLKKQNGISFSFIGAKM